MQSDKIPAGPVTLTLADAVKLGLAANLGVLTADDTARASRAQRLRALSDLLPYVSIDASETSTQVNLAAFGFKFNLPPGLGFSIPTVVGPFQYSQLLGECDPIRLRSGCAPQLACQPGERARFESVGPRCPRNGGPGRRRSLSPNHRHRCRGSDRSALKWRTRKPSIIRRKFVKKPAPTPASMSRARWSNCRASNSASNALQSDLRKQKLAVARLIGVPLDRELIAERSARVQSAPSTRSRRRRSTSVPETLGSAGRREPGARRRNRCVRRARRASSLRFSDRGLWSAWLQSRFPITACIRWWALSTSPCSRAAVSRPTSNRPKPRCISARPNSPINAAASNRKSAPL